MSVQARYQQPVSSWYRALAGLLFVLCSLVIADTAWAIFQRQVLRGVFHTLMATASAGLILSVCGPIVLSGHPPGFWLRFENRFAATNEPDAPFWRRRAPRPPRWLWRLSVIVLGCLALGYASIGTVGLSDRLDSPRALVFLGVMWCLALGAVGALIMGWRADPYGDQLEILINAQKERVRRESNAAR
jgi:hypothetical protein